MTSTEDLAVAHRRQKKRAADARRLLRRVEEAHRTGDTTTRDALILSWRSVLDPFHTGRYDDSEEPT
ncbi:hypothetical protein [uncultured Microbacterium sp.]|uniref:hypothetical protein n=1 Tax=uncultured Microbacterium sp. TaxID=191216 RepID=UPI0025D40C01|nr:hypothetical protein [uncultured Microbacterium sp.]